MTALWERQPLESRQAFAAFCRYRDLGPTRSLDTAYRHYKGTKQVTAPGTWRQWSSHFAWARRATAYDDHVDALRRKTAEKEIALQTRKQVREIEISARAALEENAALAHSNIKDLMEWDEKGVRLKNSEDLPLHVTAAVSKVSVSHDRLGNPNISVEMHPKVRPIDLEGQHFQLWESDKKQAAQAATNNFLDLLATIKSGKLDQFVKEMKPSLLHPPPGITITRKAPMTVDDLDEVIKKDEY